MTVYRLVPKTNKGTRWYMNKSELFAGNYVKVFSKDGFETVVDIRNYNVCK